MIRNRTILIGVLAALGLGALAACNPSDVASNNLSRAADRFEIDRRIVFYNGITDTYMLEIQGRCSLTDQGNQLEVTCRIGPDEYAKHFLGLSDNVTYFAEQIGPADVSVYHHRVVFRPQTVLPAFELDFSAPSTRDAIPNQTTPIE